MWGDKMPLNKFLGNMYEPVTHTWNPIKGDCPHDCSYCYVKRIYKRFKKEQGPLCLDEKELNTNLGEGNFIFVGSSCDMFADNVSVPDVKAVINRCCEFPDNKYLFQSKNACGLGIYALYVPDNSVLCTTIETNREYYPVMGWSPLPVIRVYYFKYISAYFETHITIEPVLNL
jgi:protein gp37